jgi:hypothetical protein
VKTCIRITGASGALLALFFAFASLPAAAQCDASCLTAAMDDYLAKVISHRTGEIRIAPHALIYYNTHAGTLDQNPLGRAKTIKGKQVFTDPVTGNVVGRTGLELEDGRIAYASSRLKIVNGAITQIETSFDDSPRVVASYMTTLNPSMTMPIPPGQKMSRGEMKALVERYFQALTDHKAAAADYADGCDRYHSGQKITNNARNTVEGGRGAMTCYTSVLGNRPWGPATDIHIPIVDTENGIVVGYTLLMYQDGSAPMYVSEVFKIFGGRLQMIDNIGLKMDGNKAIHFPD